MRIDVRCRTIEFFCRFVIFSFIVVTIGPAANAIQAQPQDTPQKNAAKLHGRIIDSKTGEAISKVKIIVIGLQISVTSDDAGNFVLSNVTAGDIELYISTVGYGLIKKKVTIAEGEDKTLDVALSQEAAPQTAVINVTAKPYEDTVTNVASESTLNKSEMRTLSSVLAGDPIRAAQALPGAVGNDDFTSGFSLRGAGFDRVGLYLDGIQIENPVHTVQGTPDTGSLSVLNADAINGVSLFSGAPPAKFGDSTAGALSLETRDGNRVRPSGRISISLLSASAVVDGPLAGGKGSWLVSGRKSYLNYAFGDYIQRRVGNNQAFILDFGDVEGRANYDLNSRNQIGVTALFGRSTFDQSSLKPVLFSNDILKGDSDNWIVNGNWTYSRGSQLVSQTHVFGARSSFKDRNPSELVIQNGYDTQYGVRNDTSVLVGTENRIEFGGIVRELQGTGFFGSQPSTPPVITTINAFDNRAGEQGFYAQDTWTRESSHLSLTGGFRVDHSALARQSSVTPKVALSFAPKENLRLRAGWGQYTQFPDFANYFGRFGNPNLKALRATHYNASIEQLIGDRTRVVAEFYDREDRNLLSSLSILQLPNLIPPVTFLINNRFNNGLNGHARGVEVSLQRRSANRLTGWISYSYSATHLHDQFTGLDFVSDFDQRHTISTYGSYRISETINLSGEWRYGSGLPLTTYFSGLNAIFPFPDAKNPQRLPTYSRLDLRINKAFNFKRSKLTLSGEVLNATDRHNFRSVFLQPERLLPILPSAGIAFEF
jgi:outer membrane cobalamin receptor